MFKLPYGEASDQIGKMNPHTNINPHPEHLKIIFCYNHLKLFSDALKDSDILFFQCQLMP